MLFSFLIPTTRVSCSLRAAVKSVQDLNCPDSEIIVSLNSTDDSVIDELRSLYRNSNVQIVHPDRFLSHAEHWDFLISHAAGEWITLVTDRSVLRHDWLTTLSDYLENSDIITYKSAAVLRRGQRFVVQLPWFSGQAVAFEANKWWAAARTMQFVEHGPYLLNCLIRRSALARIRARFGKLCGHLVGDCGFYASALACGENWLHVDRPMMAMHSAETGIGASLVTGTLTPALESFLLAIANSGGLRYAPLPEIVTNMNIRVNECGAVMSALGEPPIFDSQAYCECLAAEFLQQQQRFPGDALKRVQEFARKQKVFLRRLQSTDWFRRSKRSVRNALEPLLPSALTTVRNKLNLSVRSFASLPEAITFGNAAIFHPNTPALRSVVWH